MTNKTFLKWQSFLLILIISTVLAGCGIFRESGEIFTTTAIENPISPTAGFSSSPGGFGFGEDAQWPDYIPEDIPVLEGEINTVMEGGSHIRLFYRSVSINQVVEYLNLLEHEGFDLEYIVYVQEGFPDRSEEKKEKGEYDAVRITKGEYHLNITYSADPVLDVYTSGFQEEASAATALQWPPDLPESVPQPALCVLQTINPMNTGDFEEYHITCKKEGDNVEQEYIQLLLSSGFEEKNRTQIHNIVIETTVFENDETIVIPSIGFSPTFFTIQVIIKTEPEPLQWPEELNGVVPAPERGEIDSILPLSDGDYLITFKLEDEEVFPEYLQTLETTGFVEQNKMLQNEEIISITLTKGSLSIILKRSTFDPLSLILEVRQVAP